MASLLGRVENLVVEDGEVQRETESDGVSRSEFGRGDLGCSLVRLVSGVGSLLALISSGEFGEVTVVISLHLVVEDLIIPNHFSVVSFPSLK